MKLHNQDGVEIDLADVLRENVVVLYFYPKNFTPGCSVEAKDFRSRKDEIESLGAKVVGVSLDTVDSHKQFADEYGLNFDILSDAQRKVSSAYGVLGEFNGVPIAKRTTFIIGRDGLVNEVFRDVNVHIHGEQVIEALRQGITR